MIGDWQIQNIGEQLIVSCNNNRTEIMINLVKDEDRIFAAQNSILTHKFSAVDGKALGVQGERKREKQICARLG